MPNITKKWKRALLVGCSHGDKIDHLAADAVIKFRDALKPDTVVHLGDFIDTAAFRSGAQGSEDESTPVRPDIDSGLTFLKALRPTIICNGNHEARLWRLKHHHNAVVSELANQIIESFRSLAKSMKSDYMEKWDINNYRMVGNYKVMHGYMFGENATRDHADVHGNIIHAHTHRPAMAQGRRDESATGYCVGTLSNIPAMEYASTRRSTHAWAQGFVWGEYTEKQSVFWLHVQPKGQKEWVLPI